MRRANPLRHRIPRNAPTLAVLGQITFKLHPEDRDDADRVLSDALAGDGTAYESEYRIIRPSDGAVRWIAARADIERDTDGKPVRLVGAHVDITDQKRAEHALRDSEGRLRAGILSGPKGGPVA